MEERENRKRGREDAAAEPRPPPRRGKRQEAAEPPPAASISRDATARPAGVFDFPWGASGFLHESDGWDLRDVFFSSLVDGRSAAIGFPGARLSPSPAIRIDLSWPSDYDTDGLDCSWVTTLAPWISAKCSETSNT